MITVRSYISSGKGFAVGLTTVLVATVLVAFTGNQQANASTCSTTDTGYAAGSGTSADPYQIATAGQLIYLSEARADWNGKHFLQTANIDLGNCEWGMIGDATDPFNLSVYDGGGYSISGVTKTVSSGGSSAGIGFFGEILGSTIRNLKIQTSFTSDRGVIGGLVGIVKSTLGPTFTVISRVEVDTNLTFGGGNYVGGLAGSSTSSTDKIEYVSVKGSIRTTSGSSSAGGIAGTGGISTSNSYTQVAFTGSTTRNAGFVGWNSLRLNLGYSRSTGVTAGMHSGSSATVTASFWDTDIGVSTATTSTSITGATGKTTAEMKDINTYSASNWRIVDGWDTFTTTSPAKIWGICSLVNDGYPFLLWEYTTDPCTVAPPPSNSGSGSSSGSVVVAPIVVPEAVVAPRTVRQPTIRQATDNRPARLLGKSLNKDILFVADSARLSPEARKSLRQAARLAMASDGKLAVTGFAAMTNRGSAYERSVALKRARVVARFLRAQGFDDWIYFHGLSGRQGQAFEGNPRRVEIRILN